MLNRNVCLFDYIVQDKYTQFNQMVQSNCISIIIQFYMILYKFVKYIYVYTHVTCLCQTLQKQNRTLFILLSGKTSHFAIYQKMDHKVTLLNENFYLRLCFF